MRMAIQMGWGMMDHARTMISSWDGGDVILSPRDLDSNQLVALGKDIVQRDGNVVVDPQFYLPSADHKRLTSHYYWPQKYESGPFWSGPRLKQLLMDLKHLNQCVGSNAYILPGTLGAVVDDEWTQRQSLLVEQGATVNAGTCPLWATIALGEHAMCDIDQVHTVIESAEKWNIKGVYLVCEHFRGSYIVDHATWMTNLLDLVAGLRLQGKRVVVGYCNQQMLLLACAAANGMAAGTWMNVRYFPPEKFRNKYEEDVKTRRIWFYSPEALSEFRLDYLDAATRHGLLGLLRPQPPFPTQYSSALFEAPQPSLVGWPEQSAFRHFLESLRQQVMSATLGTFDKTIDLHEGMLNRAKELLAKLDEAGISGQHRSMAPAIDTNLVALEALRRTSGPILRRHWSTLCDLGKD